MVGPLRELAARVRARYAMFNNNGRSADRDNMPIAQAPTNAQMLRAQPGRRTVPGTFDSR